MGLFREQDIVVVGGGDSALEEATFLTRFARSVTLVHRRDTLRASKIMQERAFANDKISYRWNSEVVSANGAAKLESVTLRDTVTGEQSELAATGLFIAVGHDPRSDLVKGQGAKVNAFVLFVVGEGIEKRKDDFAAEVAAMTRG